MAALLALAAVVQIAWVLLEFFEVMLLPRRVRRRWRPVRLYFRLTWSAWRAVAERTAPAWRTELYAVYGPLSLVALFAVWSVLLVTAFGALQWAIAARAPDAPSLLNQLYFSGVTFFTLGYGDVTATTRLGKVVSVTEAGVGFGFIAVVIGYLPVLYQLFSQREAYVLRLDARAGSPPTAVALLERHAGPQGLAALDTLLGEAERWAMELLESHLSYPMLAYYRSQQDNESWLASLAAITDACALLVAGLEHGAGERAQGGEVPRFQARMTFAAARQAIVAMARVLADAPPGVGRGTSERAPSVARDDRLPPHARAELEARLAAVGLRFADAHAETLLDEARAAYEPQLKALARRLALPLPPWLRDPDAPDNWERGAPGARGAYERAEARELQR